MPRSVTLLLPLVGLLAAVGVWVTTTPAAAQPTPTTAPSGSGVPFPPLPAPGILDVAGRLRAAVNGWLRGLVASAIDPAVDLAARSVLATPDRSATFPPTVAAGSGRTYQPAHRPMGVVHRSLAWPWRRHPRPASWVACGRFDGLAHEPWRHGVQPAGVVSLDTPAGRGRPQNRPVAPSGAVGL